MADKKLTPQKPVINQDDIKAAFIPQLDDTTLKTVLQNMTPDGRDEFLQNNYLSEVAWGSSAAIDKILQDNRAVKRTGFLKDNVLSSTGGRGKGLNLQKIKKKARLQLYYYDRNADPEKAPKTTAFVAYSKGAVDLNIKSNFNDFQQGGIPNNKFIQFAFLMNGYSPQLDVERKFCYTGSDPLTFSINCYIVLDDCRLFEGIPGKHSVAEYKTTKDYIKFNYLEQIEKLAWLTLPSRAVNSTGQKMVDAVIKLADGAISLVETGLNQMLTWIEELSSNVQDSQNKSGNGDSILATTAGDITGAIDTLRGPNKKLDLGTIEKVMGDIKVLKIPPTLAVDSGDTLAEGLKPITLCLRCGPYKIDNVIIKSFRIQNSGLGLYKGGFPAVLPITIDFESKRPATYDMFKDGGVISYNG